MTLVVLGLDALDATLVEEFDCEGLQLSNHATVETFSHSFSYPYTLEIWPTVATGLHPREHGVGATKGRNTEWSNPLVEAASRVTAHFPTSVRNALGDAAESVAGVENTIAETDASTIFDGDYRFVHNWPGVHNGRALLEIWDITKPQEGETVTVESFERELFPKSAQKFAWVEEMLGHDAELIATHVHTLDVAGHAYHRTENRHHLESTYRWVEAWVDRIRDRLSPEDEVLLLGDHGMHVEWQDGIDNASSHAWRPLAATTIDEPLFEDMFEVADWIESHVSTVAVNEESLDLPTEQLEQLGYID